MLIYGEGIGQQRHDIISCAGIAQLDSSGRQIGQGPGD